MRSGPKKKERESLAAVLLVCLIGMLVMAVIVKGVDIYRRSTYTTALCASEYRIIDMKKSETTSYSAAAETVDTEDIYLITIAYQVEGVAYTDQIRMLTGTDLARKLHQSWLEQDAPEEVLGTIYYVQKDPSHIGRYGD